MRELNSDFQSHMNASVTSVCWAWRIILQDQTSFGFTDHDCDLEFDGVIFVAASGLSPGAVESQLGFAIDNGVVVGLLSAERFDAVDIAQGRFDNAIIESFRVNWQNPAQRQLVATGYLGAIRQTGAAFEAEWLGMATHLERSTGRIFSRLCDAEFGDDRCTLNRAGFPEGTMCPRTFEACRDVFDNTVNYRGFPYLIGDDALQAAPQEGEVFDGRSRYK